MPVTIKNDGKRKWQSFTATLDIPHTNAHAGHFSGEMVAYGSTAKEALRGLMEVVKAMSLAIAEAQSPNCVSWKGGLCPNWGDDTNCACRTNDDGTQPARSQVVA